MKLDNNYTVQINGVHGFTLQYESDPIEKEVKGEIKMVIKKESWYYPKLSQAMERYMVENLEGVDLKELIVVVKSIEYNIKQFSKTFANKGELLTIGKN